MGLERFHDDTFSNLCFIELLYKRFFLIVDAFIVFYLIKLLFKVK